MPRRIIHRPRRRCIAADWRRLCPIFLCRYLRTDSRCKPIRTIHAVCRLLRFLYRLLAEAAVSAGERDTIQVSVRQDIVQNCLCAAGRAAMDIMCFRVLAAGQWCVHPCRNRTHRIPGPLTRECRSIPCIRMTPGCSAIKNTPPFDRVSSVKWVLLLFSGDIYFIINQHILKVILSQNGRLFSRKFRTCFVGFDSLLAMNPGYFTSPFSRWIA